MKKNHLTKSILSGSLVLVFSAVVACSSADSGKTADQHGGVNQAESASPGVKFEDEKASNVYEAYLRVKDAMVRADTKGSQKGAEALENALEKAGSSKGAVIASKIARADALKEQRLQLDALTFEVEKLLRSAKISGGKIYKQHCPMANNGKGGYWLAAEAAIKNPYYGDEMLTCGSVEGEIGPKAGTVK